jgi:hypothetical protein
MVKLLLRLRQTDTLVGDQLFFLSKPVISAFHVEQPLGG